MRALRGIRVNRDAELVYLSVVTLATRNLRGRERSTRGLVGILWNIRKLVVKNCEARFLRYETREHASHGRGGNTTRYR